MFFSLENKGENKQSKITYLEKVGKEPQAGQEEHFPGLKAC